MNPKSAKKVREFAQRELSHILGDAARLVIWDVSEDQVAIGKFVVSRERDAWIVPIDSVHRKIFGRKSNAVAYAMLWQKNFVDRAQDLEKNDQLLTRLQNEIDLLQARMKTSLRDRDYEKFDLYRNKYTNAAAKKRHVVDQIEKTLNSTKYIKIG